MKATSRKAKGIANLQINTIPDEHSLSTTRKDRSNALSNYDRGTASGRQHGFRGNKLCTGNLLRFMTGSTSPENNNGWMDCLFLGRQHGIPHHLPAHSGGKKYPCKNEKKASSVDQKLSGRYRRHFSKVPSSNRANQ